MNPQALLIVAIVLFCSSSSLWAEEPVIEAANCSAFYTVVRRCAPEDTDKAQLKQADHLKELSNSVMFTIGRSAGLSDADITAKGVMAIFNASKTMEADCANLPKLGDLYAAQCKKLLEERLK
jgi:hypothetical protein